MSNLITRNNTVSRSNDLLHTLVDVGYFVKINPLKKLKSDYSYFDTFLNSNYKPFVSFKRDWE
jgi:hypothetical protein